jgi:hypothetical protein
MKQNELVNLLNDNDFHIDPLGRMVIDNPEILTAINGALMSGGMNESLFNGGCSNSGCH